MENAIARKLELPQHNPLDIESIFINRLASVGQKSLAEHMKLSESAVSRWKTDGYFRQIAEIMAFLKIHAVPPEAAVVSRDYLTSVETLADIGLRAERARPGPLGWD